MRRRAVRLLLLAVVAAAVLFLFAFPVRTLIDQHHQINQATARVKGLSAENKRLSAEAKQLQTPSAIEKIARADYGLAMPGQHVYEILPPTQSSTTTSSTSTTTTTTLPPVGLGG